MATEVGLGNVYLVVKLDIDEELLKEVEKLYVKVFKPDKTEDLIEVPSSQFGYQPWDLPLSERQIQKNEVAIDYKTTQEGIHKVAGKIVFKNGKEISAQGFVFFVKDYFEETGGK